MKPAPLSDIQIRNLAGQWEDLEHDQEALDERRKSLLNSIVPAVLAHGTYPPRATKTKALITEEGLELRVTQAQETTVRTDVALEVRDALREAGLTRLFRKLFRKVEQFVVAPKAHDLAADRLAPAALKLFNRAIRVDDKSPAVEVRHPEKKERAA